MTMVQGLSLILFIIFLIPKILFAETLFEAYYKVSIGGAHVGYSILRYEFDNKKKQFISTYFLKTNELAENLTESLKAVATEEFVPLSYSYKYLKGKETKTIDATFKKGKMQASIKIGNKIEKTSLELEKGVFLVTFLPYVMLKNPQGLNVNSNYDYKAIAEEDALVYEGSARIKNKEKLNGFNSANESNGSNGSSASDGISVFNIENEFKKSKYTSFMNERGEVFATRALAQGIQTDLVALPAEAIGKISNSNSNLKSLFGETPLGQANELSKASAKLKATTASTATTTAASALPKITLSPSPMPMSSPTSFQTPSPSPSLIPGKQIGIPGGKGILLKGGKSK